MDVRAAFNAIVGNLEYPMFIVTARAGDERLGCLVGFATQTSIDPPRFAVGLSHENRTYRRGRDSAALAVHCVPADARGPGRALRRRDRRRGRQVRALRVARRARRALPILDRCEHWFVGRVVQRVDAGDHELFLLEPDRGERRPRGRLQLPPREADRARPSRLSSSTTTPAPSRTAPAWPRNGRWRWCGTGSTGRGVGPATPAALSSRAGARPPTPWCSSAARRCA